MNTTPDENMAGEVGQSNFQSEVAASNRPVLVVFGAGWSRPCRILGKVLDELAAECADKLKLVRVNADNSPDLSLWYDIQSVPTLLYFLNGVPRARIVGTASKEAILSKLELLLRDDDSTSLAPQPPKNDGPAKA